MKEGLLAHHEICCTILACFSLHCIVFHMPTVLSPVSGCLASRYAEAMDCMLLVLKSGTPAAQSPMVSACLTEMLERSEAIKAKHAS
jgi:hypothetical protein